MTDIAINVINYWLVEAQMKSVPTRKTAIQKYHALVNQLGKGFSCISGTSEES